MQLMITYSIQILCIGRYGKLMEWNNSEQMSYNKILNTLAEPIKIALETLKPYLLSKYIFFSNLFCEIQLSSHKLITSPSGAKQI